MKEIRELFREKLINEPQDMEHSNRMWDRRAEEMSLFSEEDSRSREPYMEFFLNRAEIAAASVIDLGCGAGRYLRKLLDAGAMAEGLEPSTNMRTEALRYLEKSGYQKEAIRIHPVAFQDFVSEGQYDYVFISNSPIIRYYENYEKILRLARKGIFIGSWMERKDLFFEKLAKGLGNQPPGIFAPYVYYLFNLLMADGYYPEFHTVPERTWRKISPKDCLARYASWLYGEDYSDEKQRRMQEEMEKLLAEQGEPTGECLGVRGLLYVDLTSVVPTGARK